VVFEILIREHADMLAAYLRSLVTSPAAIEDLFQETMLVAWRRLGDFDRSRPFAPWLRGIATHLVMAHRRASADRQVMSCEPAVLEELEVCFATLGQKPGDSFRDRADKLRRCMDRLPDKLREVIELAYARGMLLRQIAESLGSGEEAVKKRMQRARESLIECFFSSEAAS
jgi:RNA polymerase sigma-70 factor (ECF subfamily)